MFHIKNFCYYCSCCVVVVVVFVMTFMQGTYNYIPERNNVSRVYSVAALLYLQFVATLNVISHVKYYILLH